MMAILLLEGNAAAEEGEEAVVLAREIRYIVRVSDQAKPSQALHPCSPPGHHVIRFGYEILVENVKSHHMFDGNGTYYLFNMALLRH